MASRPTPRIWRHPTAGRAGSRRASSSSSAPGDGREDSNTGSSIRPFTQASLERLETRACEARKHFGAMPRRPARLEDGDLLPNKFSPFPAHMYGRPLEEFDRFILDETFCAVSRRFNKNYIHRFTATRTFFLFSPWNPVRRACIFLSTNQYFDYVVMCTIISNCIFLAMSNPPDEAEFIFLAIYSLEATVKSIAKGFILNKYTYLRSAWNWLDFIVIVLGYVTMFVELGNLAGLRTFRVLRALKTVSIMPGLRTIINALLNSLTQLVEVMSLTVFCLMVFALFALQVFMGALRNKCVVTPQTPDEWRIRLNDSSYWALDHADSFAVCGNGSGAQKCLPGYVCVANIGDNPNFGYTNFDNFFWAMLTTFQLITLDFWEDVYNKVIAAVGPWSIIFFGMVVFFGSFYLINLMLAVVAMSYEVEAENSGEEKSKDLTDHRDDSTFSFDPSNLKLRPLDKNSKFSNVRLKDNSLLSYNYKKKKKKRSRTTTGDGSLGDNCSEVSPVPGEFAAGYRSGPSLVGELLTPGGFEEEEDEERRHGELVPSPAPSGLSPVPRLQPISPGGVSWLEGVTQRHPLRSSCEQLLEDSPPPPAARGCGAGGTGASVRVFPGGQRGEYFVHITTGHTPPPTRQLPQHQSQQLQQPRETLRANMFGPSVESQGIGVGGGGGGNSESSSGDRRSVVDAGGGRRGATIRACSLDDSGVVGDQESDRGRDLIVPVEEITRYDSATDGRQYTIPQPADKCNGINSDCDSQDRPAYVSHVVEIPDELEDRNCGWCPKVCPNYAGWLHWQNRLYQFVSDPCFDVFITLCIILNTLFLALEHHGMTAETKDALEIGNRVFTSIFTLECFLKVSSNCKHFFLNGWNVFDLIVVLASLVELSLQDINGLSVLRVLRLLRVLKLAQSWTTMRVLLSIIISSLGALGNLTFVLVIVIYIFAVIGMQLFAASYTVEVFAPDPIPRWNFNDFFHAFMMIFRILCGEWIEPLWDCMRAKRNEWEICLAVFLPTLVMGNFLVLNLFLALLLNSFNCEELKSRKEEARGKSKLVQSMHRLKGYIRHHRQERQALMVVRAFRSGSKTAGPMAVETTIEVPTELPCDAGDPRHTAAVWHRQRQSSAEENGFRIVQSKLEDATPELELYLPGMGRDGSVCDQDMFLQSIRSCDFPDNNEPRSHALITMDPRGSPELRAVNLRQQSSVSFSSPEADAPWTQKSWCRGQRDSTEFEVIKRRPISEQESRDSMRYPDAKRSRISSEKDSFDAGRASNDFHFCPGRLLRGSSAERRLRDLTPEERLRASQSPSSTSNWSNLATYVETLRGKSKDEDGEEDGGGTANKDESEVAATVRKEPPDCLPAGCYQYLPWQSESSQSSRLYTIWASTRRAALNVVLNSYFEWIVLTMIVASSVTLCFEDKYLYRKPHLQMALRMANLGFAVLFAAEMVLKQVALGLKKYFTNAWTILDFVIVVASIFSLAIEENERLVALRSLRTVRALRPLRAISRWQGMKIVVNALMFAIPSIFNVLLVCLVFWLIFSIMGVQFFSGQFYKCIDHTGFQLTIDVVNDKFDCLQKNFTWTNSKISFDNVGHAYLALLQVATFEGWMEVMKDAVDTRGVDLQPSREANLYAYIYFVVFIVCGSFFTLNLFIGVIIDNFNMLKKKYEGGVLEMFLTDSQKNYYTALKKLGRKKPQKVIRRPINHHHAIFYDIAISRRFEIAIFALIFLNMVIMSIEHYQQPPVITAVLEIFNIIFTTVFSMEALVKIIGLRWHYFTVPWNLFDFVLVGLSILSMIIESEQMHTEFPIPPTLLRVVRVFRIGRILRLIKAAKGIRKLLFALIVSLPALFNIGALLFLIMFIYAIIGMALFANVKHTGIINDIMNFETFGNSMMLLFRLITSAGWNDVLDPLMMQPPECDLNVRSLSGDVLLYGNCGQPAFAIVFFVTFIVINFMIVINMYIAVILENFNQAHQEEEIGIVEEDLEMFYVRWAKYDPHATQFINFSQVSDFVSSLDPPMVIPKPNTVALVSFNLPIARGDKIHCLDILHALTKHVLGYVEESDEFEKLQEQMNEKFKKQFPTRKELEIVSSTRQWKQMDLAARVLQRSMKQFLKNRRERERLAMALGDLQTQTSPGRSPSATPMFLQRVASYLHVPGLVSGRRSRSGSLASVSACSDSAGSSRRSSCNIGETFGRMGFMGAGLPGLDLGGFGNGGRSASGRRRRDPAPPRHEYPPSGSGSAPTPPRVQIDLPTEEVDDDFPLEEPSHHQYRTSLRF